MRSPRAALTLTALLALAAAEANAIATPSTAQAACAHWRLPRTASGYYGITQSNRWHVNVRFSNHSALAYPPSSGGFDIVWRGQLSVSSFSADLVKLIISWQNGAGGIYTGAIDGNGFISGVTVDRFHPTSRATWHMLQHAVCGVTA